MYILKRFIRTGTTLSTLSASVEIYSDSLLFHIICEVAMRNGCSYKIDMTIATNIYFISYQLFQLIIRLYVCMS